MRALLPALFLFALTAAAHQPSGWPPGPRHATVTLWPHGAVPAPATGTAASPGLSAMPAPPSGPEHDTTTPTDKPIASRPIVRLGNVAGPTLTLYLAPASHNTGAAVVVFPGGGYSILAIDPHRIGVLGFSAGAHLAVALSTHYDQRLYPPIDAADQQSSKPDFALVIYPGYLAIADKNFEFNPDIPVTAAPPPTFLVQAEDDPVHVENVIEYFLQLKRAGVPAELHVYSKGGHGYGLRPTDLPVTRWPTLATTWMKTVGVIGK